MDILDVVILDEEKLERKHGIKPREIFELLDSDPKIFFDEKGNIPGEDVYAAMGQTYGGRYLIVFFIYKKNKVALITSARDMISKERKRYGKK
ncbi:MAG: BrnT family toxin [Chloroflexi bacterium]|nr:BrnT family toxin [Chloroflexota bacterium]